MKIMTLNTHSLLEANYLRKLAQFVETALLESPDVIALQEVSQSVGAAPAEADMLTGMSAVCGGRTLRSDNHAAWIAYLLRKAGVHAGWAWLPVKLGYGRFDEGLAMLFPGREIAQTDAVQLSDSADYGNWRRRMALGVRVKGCSDWFYNVHMGWWNDREEPFLKQWRRMKHAAQKRKDGRIWLMGDFNAPAEVEGEGYDCIRADGWLDVWRAVNAQTGGQTASYAIDGWSGRRPGGEGIRIDHIWCSEDVAVKEARLVFDGVREPRISDHFGILAEVGI